jgi:predicted RNase H-like HicB family nuclease
MGQFAVSEQGADGTGDGNHIRRRYITSMSATSTEILFVVEEAAEGGYIARAAGADIITEGDNLEELRANVREAVECHFDDASLPRLVRLHFVRDEVLTV